MTCGTAFLSGAALFDTLYGGSSYLVQMSG